MSLSQLASQCQHKAKTLQKVIEELERFPKRATKRIYDNIKDDFHIPGLNNITDTDYEWKREKRHGPYSRETYVTKGVWTGRLRGSITIFNDHTVGIDENYNHPVIKRPHRGPQTKWSWVKPKKTFKEYAKVVELGERKVEFLNLPRETGVEAGKRVEVGTLVSYNAIKSIPEMFNDYLRRTTNVFMKRHELYSHEGSDIPRSKFTAHERLKWRK